MQIVPGPAGLLWRSGAGDCEMLKVKFTVTDGPYARKQFWENMIIEGATDGQKAMAEHWCRTRKAILESARNIQPGDETPQARAAYLAELPDFDGMGFIAKVGVEEGKTNQKTGEKYDDKNILAAVITPDKKEWKATPQTPPFNGGGGIGKNDAGGVSPNPPSSSSGSVPKPGWAS
jgi:hypothetical protein